MKADELLSPHFKAYELNADDPAATPGIIENLRGVAQFLEAVRAETGTRILVNDSSHSGRGFRPPQLNAAVGGSLTSSHKDGLAADTVPLDITYSRYEAAIKSAITAGRLPSFDQVIYYPKRGFIHFGLGSRMRRQQLIDMGGVVTAFGFMDGTQQHDDSGEPLSLGVPMWVIVGGLALGGAIVLYLVSR